MNSFQDNVRLLNLISNLPLKLTSQIWRLLIFNNICTGLIRLNFQYFTHFSKASRKKPWTNGWITEYGNQKQNLHIFLPSLIFKQSCFQRIEHMISGPPYPKLSYNKVIKKWHFLPPIKSIFSTMAYDAEIQILLFHKTICNPEAQMFRCLRRKSTNPSSSI